MPSVMKMFRIPSFFFAKHAKLTAVLLCNKLLHFLKDLLYQTIQVTLWGLFKSYNEWEMVRCHALKSTHVRIDAQYVGYPLG
jgi:hypothetical protein